MASDARAYFEAERPQVRGDILRSLGFLMGELGVLVQMAPPLDNARCDGANATIYLLRDLG
jgi:hypothetical protein